MRDDYRLELLDEDSFEALIIKVCQKILGIGVVSFTKGRDGGKDGRFEGKAECYPSKSDQWKGKFIIQAKHSTSPVSSCSDRDFRLLVNKEIKKIKILKANNQVDNYLLFTNRKYTGETGENLSQEIKTETGVENVSIIGKETLHTFVDNNIVREFNLNRHHIPFDFSEEDIREIILAFKKDMPNISDDISKMKSDFSMINIKQKNEKNKLGEEYYKEIILENSLEYFNKIRIFLENPINEKIKEIYYDIASELNNLIAIRRNDFDAFEEIFVLIYQKICDGNKMPAKRHIYHLLHFMYFECLIGKR
jgi:hypothetical protein